MNIESSGLRLSHGYRGQDHSFYGLWRKALSSSASSHLSTLAQLVIPNRGPIACGPQLVYDPHVGPRPMVDLSAVSPQKQGELAMDYGSMWDLKARVVATCESASFLG